MTASDPRDRLIIALDVPSIAEARALVDAIGDAATFYKVGLELVMQGGLDLVRTLAADGKRVFLDMKLLDIPNTVERAVANAATSGAALLTIHGIDSRTVAAAAAGARGSALKILGVTVLTSVDAADLAEQGIATTPTAMAVTRARLVVAAGGHGIVASGQEAAAIRSAIGPGKLIVTPGIRLPDTDPGDQARVATPASAIAAGADHIVVGRPISQASNPRAAAERFQAAINSALAAPAQRRP